jgi:transcription initiation factor TFIIH subunit 2
LQAVRSKSDRCYACQSRFPEVPRGDGGLDELGGGGVVKGMSESGRYACTVCGNHFCIDCDVFAHEIVHNCPGCQSDSRGSEAIQNGDERLVEDDIYGMEPMVE